MPVPDPETGVPCFIAVTKEAQRRNPRKPSRIWAVQHEGALKCKSKFAFRNFLSVSQIELSNHIQRRTRAKTDALAKETTPIWKDHKHKHVT